MTARFPIFRRSLGSLSRWTAGFFAGRGEAQTAGAGSAVGGPKDNNPTAAASGKSTGTAAAAAQARPLAKPRVISALDLKNAPHPTDAFTRGDGI